MGRVLSVAAMGVVLCGGLESAARAEVSDTCNPPCAPGQLCVEGLCMVPAPPPAAPPEGAPPPASAPAYAPPPPPPSSDYPPAYGYPPPAYGYPPPGYPPPPQWGPRPPRYGDFLHNGFYLRAAVGASMLLGTVEDGGVRADFAGDLRGTGLAFDGAIGGSPRPGLVVAGAMFASAFGRTTVEDLTAGGMLVVLMGPMIDVYPDPTTGFHLEGSIGAGPILWDNGRGAVISIPGVPYNGGAAGLTVGAGYEGWVGRRLSLGGIVRVSWQKAWLSPTDRADRADYVDIELGFACLSLLASLTLN